MSGYSVFLAEKLHLLRQLEVYAYADDAVLANILERAWKKYDDTEKEYYVKKARSETGDYDAPTPLAMAIYNQYMTSIISSSKVLRNIYFKEMRLIVLQDPEFVRKHFNVMPAILLQGWYNLSRCSWQLLDYCKKAAQHMENAKKPATSTASKDATVANASTEKADPMRKAHWDNHSWKCLMNETDSVAFCEFANTMQVASPFSISPNAMFKKWTALKDEEQDKYYEKVPRLYALIYASKAFLEENALIKPGQFGYEDEQRKLLKAWNDLCEEARSIYTDIVYQERLIYESNPENRFIGKHNDRTLLADLTTMDTDNAKLTPIPPFTHLTTNNNMAAFIIFMESRRPDLIKDPKFAKKRYWDVNDELLGEWLEKSDEDKKNYRDIVGRFFEIKSKLSEWKTTANDVCTTEMKNWKDLFARCDIAIENRNILLKKYPDLYEYYAWTRSDDIPTVFSDTYTSLAPKSAVDRELDEAVQQFENTLCESEKADPYRFDQNTYGDTVDNEAFNFYRCEIASTCPEELRSDVLWQQFIRLSDNERDVYYSEALKKQASLDALKLFVKDKLSIEKTNENETEYAELMQVLHKKWENLSAPSKQYYIDIAEQNLLQRKKLDPEDACFPEPMASYLTTKDALNEPNAHLQCKYAFKYHKQEDYQKARVIYMRKELPQLLKEPGMADKRYFQLKLILGLRFSKLSDEERKPYYDMLQRIVDICSHAREFRVNRFDIMYQRFGPTQQWDLMCDYYKILCIDDAKENRLKLLKEFPDLDEHFDWIVYKKYAETDTGAEASKTTESVTETAEEVVEETRQSELTESETDHVDVEKQDVEVVTETTEPVTNDKIPENAVEENHYDTPPKEVSEVPEVSVEEKDVEVNADESVESNFEVVTNVETSETKDTPAEPERSADNWDLVDGKDDSQEAAASNGNDAKSHDVSENDQNLEVITSEKVAVKKTPTAIMFYKKAMRLQFGKDYGKDPAQRKKLIADWKNLSDEAKAVYFEKERLANLKLQQK